jgi:hypothetical protein
MNEASKEYRPDPPGNWGRKRGKEISNRWWLLIPSSVELKLGGAGKERGTESTIRQITNKKWVMPSFCWGLVGQVF